MSSPSDPDEVSASELADLAAGHLDPDRARTVRARLARDPQLLAAYGRLRAFPSPVPATGVGVAVTRWRDRVTVWRGCVLTLAAAAAAAAVVVLGHSPLPGPARGATDVTGVITVASGRVGELWPGLGDVQDPGFLTAGDRLSTCFLFGSPQLLGSRPVIVDGRYGVAVAVVEPEDPDTVRIEVLSRDCGPYADPDAVIASATARR